MKREELIAPELYNLSVNLKSMQQVQVRRPYLLINQGEKKEITYEELMAASNQGGKCLYRKRSSKRRCPSCYGAATDRGICNLYRSVESRTCRHSEFRNAKSVRYRISINA